MTTELSKWHQVELNHLSSLKSHWEEDRKIDYEYSDINMLTTEA